MQIHSPEGHHHILVQNIRNIRQIHMLTLAFTAARDLNTHMWHMTISPENPQRLQMTTGLAWQVTSVALAFFIADTLIRNHMRKLPAHIWNEVLKRVIPEECHHNCRFRHPFIKYWPPCIGGMTVSYTNTAVNSPSTKKN